MGVYLLLLVIGLISLKAKSNKVSILFCLLMVLFAALRADSVGTDTIRYVDRFVYTGEFDIDNAFNNHKRVELIWNGLYILIEYLGLDSRWILGVASLLTITNIYIASRRSSRNVSLSLFLFLVLYYLSSYNAMRQITAASFLLVGYTFLNFDNSELSSRRFFKKTLIIIKKNLLFFLWVSIACLIHFSSWMYFFVFLIPLIRINKKLLIVAVFFSYIVGFFFNASFLSNYIIGFDHLDHLLSGAGEGSINYTILGQFTHFLFVVIYSAIIYFSNDDKKTLWRFAHIFVAGIILQNLLFEFSTYISRVSIGLMLIQILYIPNAILSMKKGKRISFYLFLVLLLSILFIRNVLSNSNGVYPYLFF